MRCWSSPRARALKSRFCKPFQADLVCPVSSLKIIVFTKNGNRGLTPRIPCLMRGRIAIVTTRGAGLRWTHWRARTKRRQLRTVKSCGPDLPMLGSSLACDTQGDGGYQAVPRGEREAAGSNHRAGNAGSFGMPVVTNSCAFFAHARLRVCKTPGIPCTLSLEGGDHAKLGQLMSRERGGSAGRGRLRAILR